jgi:hypothetical protein
MVHFFATFRKARHMILYIAPSLISAERFRATFCNQQFSGSIAFAMRTARRISSGYLNNSHGSGQAASHDW